jgi:spore maturation protein CgeB
MNVLVVGKFYVEGFALHIAETCSDMGHAVLRFDPGPSPSASGRGLRHRISQFRQLIYSTTTKIPVLRAREMLGLWKIAARSPLDLVIVCHDFLQPEEVETLKQRTGAQVVLWFPDPIGNFGSAYFMNAPYDVLFFKDPYIVYKLKELLKNRVCYLPECFNPKRHWLLESEDNPAYHCDLTLVGNLHSQRIALCNNLAEWDVKLWGKPARDWMRLKEAARMYQGRPVYDHDKVRAFRGAKIVINDLRVSEIWGLNVRAFEVAGAGGFQLIGWRGGLQQLFSDGEEIVSYRGLSDLKSKIEIFLKDNDRRKAIAAAGMRRAFAEHTYELRLKLLIETTMGAASGFPMLRQNPDAELE